MTNFLNVHVHIKKNHCSILNKYFFVQVITVTPDIYYAGYNTIEPDDEGKYDLSDATNFSSPRAYTVSLLSK